MSSILYLFLVDELLQSSYDYIEDSLSYIILLRVHLVIVVIVCMTIGLYVSAIWP